MKRLVLCLAIVALMALPAMAEITCDDGCPTPPSTTGTVGIDVQGYVDGTASYQTGCVEQFSCEKGTKEICDLSASAKVTDFNCAAHVPGRSCGVDVNQFSFDGSLTKTEITSEFKEKVEGNFTTGAAAMNSLGGVAICTTLSPTLCANAVVANNHAIQQTATYSGDACTATSSYQGSQSLNLSTSFNAPR